MAPPPPRHDPSERPGSPGTQVEVSPEEAEAEEIAVEGEGWAVILHNDDVNIASDVVESVMRATGFPLEQAFHIVQEAHVRGRAIVTITDKDEAAHIVSILRTDKLTAEMQPR